MLVRFCSLSSTASVLSGLEQGTILQRTTTVVHFDDISVRRQNTLTAHLDILFAGISSKSPFQTLQNLLATGKLEFSTTNRFNDMGFMGVLGTDREQNLTNVDAGSDANRFTVRVAHTGTQTIGSGTTQHLIGAQDVEGMGANANVVVVFSNVLGQVLVDGDTASLQGFAADLLFLVAHQVCHKGELIDGGLLGARVKDANLGFRDTTAVPTLDVRLVLLVTVATGGTATHLDWFSW